MSEEAAFLEALKANPADDTARLVYADWLDEHSEPAKAEYLRLVATLAQAEQDYAREQPDVARLLAVAETLPQGWREATGSRFKLVFCSCNHANPIPIMRAIRLATGCGLAEAKGIAQGCPHVIFASTPFELGLVARDTVREAHGTIHLSPCDNPPVLYQIVARRLPSSSPETPPDVERRANFATFLKVAMRMSSAVQARRLALHDSVTIAEYLDANTAQKRLLELHQLLPHHLSEPNLAGRYSSSGVWLEQIPITPPHSPK